MAAFAVQMAFNVMWTPVFFGLRRPDLGFLILMLLWLSAAATAVAFDRVDRRASLLLLPYLAWLSYALFLNYSFYAAG